MKKNWLDKLEEKFGHLALDGLMYYIAGLMITVYFLNSSNLLPYYKLSLIVPPILHGEIWRLITFLIIPTSQNPFFLFFELMIIIMCANGIEAAMGSFKLTVYYCLGAVLMIIACFIAYSFNYVIQLDSYLMYLSLFWGYATLYPDEELLFMFFIPVKIKYLAYLSAIGIIIPLLIASWPTKIVIILSFTNYLIFFTIPALQGIKYARQQTKRREAFEKAVTPQNPYRHKCSVCGKTDVTDPDIIFKYCICEECGPNGVAFCPEHLKEHKMKHKEE